MLHGHDECVPSAPCDVTHDPTADLRLPMISPRADESSLALVRLLEHLRSCVVRHVCERRAEGAPLARVIPEVRCLVREAESCEGWEDLSGVLMTQVVQWSTQAYHDEPELQHVLRFS